MGGMCFCQHAALELFSWCVSPSGLVSVASLRIYPHGSLLLPSPTSSCSEPQRLFSHEQTLKWGHRSSAATASSMERRRRDQEYSRSYTFVSLDPVPLLAICAVRFIQAGPKKARAEPSALSASIVHGRFPESAAETRNRPLQGGTFVAWHGSTSERLPSKLTACTAFVGYIHFLGCAYTGVDGLQHPG